LLLSVESSVAIGAGAGVGVAAVEGGAVLAAAALSSEVAGELAVLNIETCLGSFCGMCQQVVFN
jgi:hypothetical protein